ncbi:MAG: hypothetical protein ACRDZO_09700 [Egibacteraceae bacterium]
MVTLFIILLAVVAGLLANHYLRPRLLTDDTDGPSIRDMIVPVETLAVLVLAFVFVSASTSFDAAADAADAEAGVVDHMFETAEYLPEPQRQELLAGLVCYSRAVHNVEWDILAEGDGERSPVPSVWSSGFRGSFANLIDDGGPIFELLVAADRERSVARQQRVGESVPAIPELLYGLMVVALAVSIAGLGFSIPRTRNRLHIVALVIIAGFFAASLLLIRDIDQPYSGLLSIEPTAIADTEQDITEDFAGRYGTNAPLPCNERGERL